MHLNLGKCNYIIYAYKTPAWAETIEIKLGDTCINRGEETKYLGIHVDEKLTWKSHSLYVQDKLRKLNYLFFHLKIFFNIYHLRRLYRSLYESTVSYGIIHWGGSAHIQPIKILQNKVCRNILSMHKRSSETEIYSKIQVMRLENLYKYRLYIYIFKNKELFRLHKNEGKTRTRGSIQAEYINWKKEHSRIQMRYCGQRLFNLLPEECRGEQRISVFKNKIRALLHAM